MSSYILDEFNGRNGLCKVYVEVERSGDWLSLDYLLEADLDLLQIPKTTSQPQFKEELWKTTCFEAFLKSSSSAYLEWNFSPSGDYWNQGFVDYRKVDPQFKELTPLLIQVESDQTQNKCLRIRSKVPLEDEYVKLGLASAVHLKNDECLYFSLKHSENRPDFHRADSFLIDL